MLHIKKVKPLFTALVTTGDKFDKDMYENGIITARKGDLKLWQRGIAIGTTVRGIEVGDLVMINADNYAVRKYNKNSLQNDLDNNPVTTYKFNWVTIDDADGHPCDCLFLEDRDILYVFEGEETEDKLIVPDRKKLLLS